MTRIKYFYSPAMQLRQMEILTDDEGKQIGVPSNRTTFIKRLPRVTVCSIYFPRENKLQLGSAMCSPKDTFVKKKARELSYKRAYRFPERTVIIKDRKKLKEVSRRTAEDLIKTHLEKFNAYVSFDV